MKDGTKQLLLQVEQIAVNGNVIPPSWYREITRSNGGTHFPAITILAELVYRYRPIILRDEDGTVTIEKKFRGDLFHASYRYWAKFGLSIKQARAGVSKLLEMSLIEQVVDKQPFTTPSGTVVNNRQFLIPNPAAIATITYHGERGEAKPVVPSALQGRPPCPTGQTPLPYRAPYMK